MRVTSCLLGAIAIAIVTLLPTAGSAQESPEGRSEVAVDASEDPATLLEDVIVESGALEREAARFIAEASSAVRGRGLARWRGPVCIGVMNFRPELGLQIADGLAHAGGVLGVLIADGDCDPNIFIIGTLDARQVATGWVAREYREFRPNIASATLSRERLMEFTGSEAPVRWWAISRPSYFDIFAGRAAPTNGPRSRPIAVHSYSLKDRNIRDDLQRLVVILDVAKVETVSLRDLVAYLTVVSFAQIDMQADMSGFDTILNLFKGSYVGAGLSDWDRAYIQSLYDVPRDLRIRVEDQPGRLSSRLRLAAAQSRDGSSVAP